MLPSIGAAPELNVSRGQLSVCVVRLLYCLSEPGLQVIQHERIGVKTLSVNLAGYIAKGPVHGEPIPPGRIEKIVALPIVVIIYMMPSMAQRAVFAEQAGEETKKTTDIGIVEISLPRFNFRQVITSDRGELPLSVLRLGIIATRIVTLTDSHYYLQWIADFYMKSMWSSTGGSSGPGSNKMLSRTWDIEGLLLPDCPFNRLVQSSAGPCTHANQTPAPSIR